MVNNKNIIPQTEEQQFLPGEQSNLQQILRQFQQPVPSIFLKLENLKHMCSTEGWKEPVCERYSCLINDKWSQVDIQHNLLEKLELEANIPYPVYISPTVLDKGLDHYLAYNVENEEEIGLDKPLTISGLPSALQSWITKIEQLKTKITELETEKAQNQATITNLTNDRDDYQNKWDNSVEDLEQKEEIMRDCLARTKDLEREREQLNGDLQTIRTELTTANTLITNIQNLLGIVDLNNLPTLPQGESLTSLLARPTPEQLQIEKDRVNGLERKITSLNEGKQYLVNENNNKLIELHEKEECIKKMKEKVKDAINKAKIILQQAETAQESAKKHALNKNSSFNEIWEIKDILDEIPSKIGLLIVSLEVKNFYEENN